MLTSRSFNVFRLTSSFHVQRTVQICGFKSRYNIENLYPNTSSDFTVKVSLSLNSDTSSCNLSEKEIPEASAEGFSGYIPIEELKITYNRAPLTDRCTVIPKVDTVVEIRFHIPSSSCISDDVKAKLMQREVDNITKDGYLVTKSNKTRLQMLNRADCLDRIRTMIFNAIDDRPQPELAERRTRHEKLKAGVLRQKRSEFEELCQE